MLLGARNAIGGVKALPYDSIVEYVKMTTRTNLQYWKTGFVPKGNYRIVLDADSAGVGDTIWVGFYPPVNYINAKQNAVYWRYGGKYGSSSATISTGRHTLELGRICKVDGVQKDSIDSNVPETNTKEIYLFDGYKIYGGGPLNLKVYGLKIYDSSDKLMVDMVPCRKNGLCEFYDRVSRKLSERVGDGSAFTYGNDVLNAD